MAENFIEPTPGMALFLRTCNSEMQGHGGFQWPQPGGEGLYEFLLAAQEYFHIHIFSSRSHQSGGIEAMQLWFLQHMPKDIPGVPLLHFPTEKPPAFLTLDDRGIQFTGVWPPISDLLHFKPWNKS